MIAIKRDEIVVQAITETAESLGMTVQEFVRSRVLGEHNGTHAADVPSYVDFDAELDAFLSSGPTLPADFSRADIYSDHE